jgi:TonB family protein
MDFGAADLPLREPPPPRVERGAAEAYRGPVLDGAPWPRPPAPSLRARTLWAGLSAGAHVAALAALLLFAPLERAVDGPPLAEIPVELVIMPPGEEPSAPTKAAEAPTELVLPAPPGIAEPEFPVGTAPVATAELEAFPLPPEVEPARILAEAAPPEPHPPEAETPVPASEEPSQVVAAVFPELPLPDSVKPSFPLAPARQPSPPAQGPAPARPAAKPPAPARPHAREIERRKVERETRRRRGQAEKARAAAAGARRAAEPAEARRGARAAAASGPSRGQPGLPTGAASASLSASAVPAAAVAYRGQVIAHLTRFKRYPESARSRGAEGTPTVGFSLDGAGEVTRAGLARSSGQSDIDAEALAMVRRAAPFPAPPAGAPRSFSASVGFRMQ